MKHPHFLKSLSLALLVTGCPLHNAVAESHCQLQPSAIIENAQEEEKLEKIQMPPHTVHVGAELGMDYIVLFGRDTLGLVIIQALCNLHLVQI